MSSSVDDILGSGQGNLFLEEELVSGMRESLREDSCWKVKLGTREKCVMLIENGHETVVTKSDPRKPMYEQMYNRITEKCRFDLPKPEDVDHIEIRYGDTSSLGEPVCKTDEYSIFVYQMS